ncbi:MAG: UvrD-helicase domain-containing protein, partial [Acidobacteriota bacterium]
MKLIADLHIHSHFSIATSKQLIPEFLDLWARIKGINIVGTGDFTHPSWIDELEEKLEPAEEGLYRLRDEYSIRKEWGLPEGFGDPVRFLLSAEISSIYKKRGKVRKVHNVVLAPDFETVRKIQAGLARRKFNITSDGRPILGMDSRDLLELILGISDRTFFIPAHIWTPWFSALGAKSGFDSIEECYEDMSPFIHAVETGLSSDPAMNWMCGFLDKYTLVSNSDAHSPEKLGREANIMDTDLSYSSITGAVASGGEDEFKGTIEFFPQEGKYHYDGHRKCEICWDPLENLRNGGLCSNCGKPVTMGVMSRIAQLSDRRDTQERKRRPSFFSIVPLKEIFSEIMGVGPNSKKVTSVYRKTIQKAGAEFRLLLDAGTEEIENAGGPLLAEAIRRMRAGEVYIQEGYDGEFGVIRLFDEGEIQGPGISRSLFVDEGAGGGVRPKPQLLRFSLQDYQDLETSLRSEVPAVAEPEVKFASSGDLFAPVSGQEKDSGEAFPGAGTVPEEGKSQHSYTLNPEQQEAVNHGSGPAMVIAGPGTGKTQVLTQRILHLVREERVAPGHILAVTFTNKAAEEMSRRINRALGEGSGLPEVATFHALGYKIINRNLPGTGREAGALLIDGDDQKAIFQDILGCTKSRVKKIRESISRFKQEVIDYGEISDPEIREAARDYDEWLKLNNLFDLDDLIAEAVRLLEGYPEIRSYWQDRFDRVLVDEFQDINRAQYKMLRLLCPEPDSPICVIGDPDQAIYGFRGSDAGYMSTFQTDYPSACIYSLKQSYRCT